LKQPLIIKLKNDLIIKNEEQKEKILKNSYITIYKEMGIFTLYKKGLRRDFPYGFAGGINNGDVATYNVSRDADNGYLIHITHLNGKEIQDPISVGYKSPHEAKADGWIF
jgi:hypothetical protein